MAEVTENLRSDSVSNERTLTLAPDTSSDQQTTRPLTAEEFRSVFLEIESLGLTWTTDLPPTLVAKDVHNNDAFASKKFEEIENAYPMLPNEVGYAIWYALTGTEPLSNEVGTEYDLQVKSAIVREFLITPEFRDEFLFRHMLNGPSLEGAEWEVVVKTAEQGIHRLPGNAYALVSILLETNSQFEEKRETFSFAINESRLNRLIEVLGELRQALHRASEIGDYLTRSND